MERREEKRGEEARHDPVKRRGRGMGREGTKRKERARGSRSKRARRGEAAPFSVRHSWLLPGNCGGGAQTEC